MGAGLAARALPKEPRTESSEEIFKQIESEVASPRNLARRRADLLASLSRELRVALATIRRYAELLTVLDCEAHQVQAMASEIQRVAEQMERLVRELLPGLAPPVEHIDALGRDTRADEPDELEWLRAQLASAQQRITTLDAELAEARIGQQQLQTYADDFRRTYAESRHRLQQMTGLYDVSATIGATVDPREVVTRIVDGFEQLLPGAGIALYLIEDRQFVRQALAGDIAPGLAAERLSLDEGLLARCLLQGEVIPDGGDHDSAATDSASAGPGDAGWKLALPLFTGSQDLGAVLVVRSADRPFADEERYLAEMVASQAAMAIQNSRLVTTDPLTGLYNRRFFEQALSFECDRGRRTGRAVGLLMIDIDRFKRFNDRFGHPAGDNVLRRVADMLGRHLRRTDIFARIGGEEFVAILPEDNREAVLITAERLRQGVEQAPTLILDGRELPGVRVTIGGASLSAEDVRSDALIAMADRALRAAKRQGRNRSLVIDAHGGVSGDNW